MKVKGAADTPPQLARRMWERRKRSAFPPGALTFHIEAWSRRALSSAGADASAHARARLHLDEFLVLHGSAWLSHGAVTLICGPAGIGKSSVLSELERSGRGRLVEDGLLLVGLRRASWHLVVTGALDLLGLASRISRRIRKLMRVDFNTFQNADVEVLRHAHPMRAPLLFHVSDVAFTLAAAFGPRRDHPFTPSTLRRPGSGRPGTRSGSDPARAGPPPRYATSRRARRVACVRTPHRPPPQAPRHHQSACQPLTRRPDAGTILHVCADVRLEMASRLRLTCLLVGGLELLIDETLPVGDETPPGPSAGPQTRPST